MAPHLNFFSAASSASSKSPEGAKATRRDRPSNNTAGLSAPQLRELYRYLFLTRRLEDHLVALYRQGQVIGGVYRSLGQEATAVGCTYALSSNDIIQPLIRDMGAMLTHGVKPEAIYRQYMAKKTGPTGGRDLNTHFSAPQQGILGPTSMLGAMIPVLAGCLWAAKLHDEHKCGLSFIGDGGSSTGAFYEGFNFAVVKNLPMLVVIESNHYAYSTSTHNQMADGDVVRRARGFGCAVWHIDGNDILACYEATTEARKHALAGKGPSIIVAETYRRRGHAEHDNQAYLDKREPQDWEAHNDPLTRFEEFLVQNKHLKEQALNIVRKAVNTELDTAREKTVQEEFPDIVHAEAGVFADGSSPWPPTQTWLGDGPKHRGQN